MNHQMMNHQMMNHQMMDHQMINHQVQSPIANNMYNQYTSLAEAFEPMNLQENVTGYGGSVGVSAPGSITYYRSKKGSESKFDSAHVVINLKEERENDYLNLFKKVHDEHFLKKVIHESNKNYIEHFLANTVPYDQDEFNYIQRVISEGELAMREILLAENKVLIDPIDPRNHDDHELVMKKFERELADRKLTSNNTQSEDEKKKKEENEEQIDVAKILQEKYRFDIADFVASQRKMNELCNTFVTDYLKLNKKIKNVFRMISDQIEYACHQNNAEDTKDHATTIIKERKELFEKYDVKALIDQWIETRNIIFYFLTLLTRSNSKKYEHECPICKDNKTDLQAGEVCGHVFCSSCLTDIAHGTCPLCRKPIIKPVKLLFC